MFKRKRKNSEQELRIDNVITTHFLNKTKAYEIHSQIDPLSLESLQIEKSESDQKNTNKNLALKIGASKYFNAFLDGKLDGAYSNSSLKSNAIKQIETLSIKQTDSSVLQCILNHSQQLSGTEIRSIENNTLIEISDLEYFDHDKKHDNVSLIKRFLPYVNIEKISDDVKEFNMSKISELLVSNMSETIYLKDKHGCNYTISLPTLGIDNIDNNYSLADILSSQINILGILKRDYKEKRVDLNPLLAILEQGINQSDLEIEGLVTEENSVTSVDPLNTTVSESEKTTSNNSYYIDVIAIFNRIKTTHNRGEANE